jgi:hypothetical protein
MKRTAIRLVSLERALAERIAAAPTLTAAS